MKLSRLVCAVAVGLVIGVGGAQAGSVTGTGSGPSNKEGCDAARANAASQIPGGAKVKKYSACKCQGQGQRKCSVSAEY